jgi:hypothetical protein
MPPAYDPAKETIIETITESRQRVAIVTDVQRPLREKHQFILLKKQGCWLVDSKKYWSEVDRAWKAYTL